MSVFVEPDHIAPLLNHVNCMFWQNDGFLFDDIDGFLRYIRRLNMCILIAESLHGNHFPAV